MRHLLLALFWALLLSGSAYADPLQDGVVAWDAGSMDDAISTWQTASDTGRASGTIHNNLGVAWYRKGNLPRAVAHWRMARLLDPRGSDPVHNLAVARAELEAPPKPRDTQPAWLQIATVGEYGVLGSVLLLLSGLGAWVARLRKWTPWPWLGVAVVGAALGVASVAGARILVHQPGAVVIGQSVSLRGEPTGQAPGRGVLPPGTEVAVERAQSGFLLVSTSEDLRGWVPDTAVIQVGAAFVDPL